MDQYVLVNLHIPGGDTFGLGMRFKTVVKRQTKQEKSHQDKNKTVPKISPYAASEYV